MSGGDPLAPLAPPPPGTGTVFDTVEPIPERAAVKPATDPLDGPPSLGELFSANKQLQIGDNTGGPEYKRHEYWGSLIDALDLPAHQNPGGGNFGPPGGAARFMSKLAGGRLVSRAEQESLIAKAIAQRRLVDKSFLTGVPDTADGINSWIRDKVLAERQRARQTLGRGEGVAGTIASFAGGIVGGAYDPTFLPQLVIGGGGAGSLVKIAVRETLFNAGVTALMMPGLAQVRKSYGEELTAHEAVTNIVVSGIAGGVLEAGFHGLRRLGPIATDRAAQAIFGAMPASVQKRWAARMKVGGVAIGDLYADVDYRELAAFSRTAIGEDRMTPEERAGAAGLEREQELGEASPFEPGPEGDAAHRDRLSAAVAQFYDGDRAAGGPRASASPIAMARTAPPVGVAMSERHWAAIIGNEGGTGRHGEFLTSPKGAIGPAQVMPGTAPEAARLAGVPFDDKKYRTDRAYNELIGRAYYAEQLRVFGEPDKAAAAYNAGPGSARRGTGLRGAMARAEQAGTPGNWEAYLPPETRQYVRDFRRRAGESPAPREAGQPGAAGPDDVALARDRAGDAEAEAQALAREGMDADPGDAGHAISEPVPLLKRALFASDEDWAGAQVAFYHSVNDGEASADFAAPSAGNGPPARDARMTGGEGPPAAPGGAGPAPGKPGELTVERYVDAYLAGEGRGDGPRDRELLQFASNNAPAIEAEFTRRASPRPLTVAELEASRPDYAVVGAKRDPLWLLAHSNAVDLAHRRALKPVWGVRDRDSGEVISWSVSKKAAEAARANHWEPERFDLERLGPDSVEAEMRGRLADDAALVKAGDVRIDEPALKAFDDGGTGRAEQVASLEHDLRMDAARDTGRRYRLTDDGEEQSLAQILADIDADRDAITAIRACAAPGGGA